MSQSSNKGDPRVLTCMELRNAIGILGAALPFVLALGGLVLFSTSIQSSLSAYYHTDMGDVFVGTLCTIGVFFYAYKGYTGELGNDKAVANWAGIFAIGVALFPADPSGGVGLPETFTGRVHIVCAAIFFSILAYFSLCLFTKSCFKPDDRPPQKRRRDKVYRAAGYTILGSIGLIVILGGIKMLGFVSAELIQAVEAWHPVFVLESVAVIAFGVAWLTKGQALMRDDPAEYTDSAPQEAATGATV